MLDTFLKHKGLRDLLTHLRNLKTRNLRPDFKLSPQHSENKVERLPLRESKAKVLEQLILLLTFEMSLEDKEFDNDRAVLESDDYEFELVVKKKRGNLRLISDDD